MAIRRYRGQQKGADERGTWRDVTPLVRQRGRGRIVSMRCIFTNAGFQSGNLRESRKVERVGNSKRTMRVLGGSGKRIQICAGNNVGIGF